MPIYPNFYQTLTRCPLVELRGYASANGLKGRLFAYLDFNGPSGTARDGLAEGMLALAAEKKKLLPGQPIIEAASGAFATALTLAGLTGPAIVQDIARENASLIDAIAIGVGSGGTITGVGETIKAWTNDVRVVAVEPFECQALTGSVLGAHGISDIGYGFVPKNYNSYVVDNVAAVSTKDALRAAQQVLRTDAIPASPSAGAALHVAARLVANGISRAALAVFSGRQTLG